jgi:hypothetical protein
MALRDVVSFVAEEFNAAITLLYFRASEMVRLFNYLRWRKHGAKSADLQAARGLGRASTRKPGRFPLSRAAERFQAK